MTLWLLVPSRGRPANVDRLVRACALTCSASTHLHFGFDADDPMLDRNVIASAAHRYDVAPRMGLVEWTNRLAAMHTGDSEALGSVGDDMVPVTQGWDRALLDALDGMGGGMAYPNDKRRDDVPEAPFVTTRLVAGLGRFFPAPVGHWFGDTALGDLYRALGRLAYLPDVIVEHRHPNVPGGDRHDQVYEDAAKGLGRDLAAYQRWRLFQMIKDINTVKGLL